MAGKRILFWRAIIGDYKVLQPYHTVINKLLTGEYQSADLDLKKMKGHRIFSVRVNDTDRLLFTTIALDGEQFLLYLETIDNHKYQKSKFLRNSKLIEKYKENGAASNWSEQDAIDADTWFDAVDEATAEQLQPVCADTDFTQEALPVVYYDNCFLRFTLEQNQALEKKLPVVISGPGGSGKSSVSKEYLLKLFAQKDPENTLPLLYVTEKEGLGDTMQKMLAAEGIDDTQIRCSSYRQLFLSINEIAENRLITDAARTEWMRQHILQQERKGKRKASGSGSSRPKLPTDVKIVFEEFRNLCGSEDIEGYLNLSKHESLIEDEAVRRVFWDAFGLYKAYLATNNLHDLLFSRINGADRFWAVVSDESQENTRHQNAMLFKLAVTRQILFCMDTQQGTKVQTSVRPHLLKLTNNNHVQFTATHRCPPSVRNLANTVIQLRNIVTEGAADKHEYSFINLPNDNASSAAGEILWADEDAAVGLDAQYNESREFAIVTLSEFKQEAEQRFKTSLIFTVDEIRGLGYPYVLMYKLFDGDKVKEINRQIKTKEITLDQERVVHRSKHGGGNTDAFVVFANIYTAITRTSYRLFVCQNTTHENEHVLALIKPLVNHSSIAVADLPTVNASSAQEWREEAARLASMGNTSQSDRILGKDKPLEVQRPKMSKQQHDKLLSVKKKFESKAIGELTERDCLRLLRPLSPLEYALLMNAKEGDLANDIFLNLVRAGFEKAVESILKKITKEEDKISLILKFAVSNPLLTVLHKAIDMNSLSMIRLLYNSVSVDNYKRLLYAKDIIHRTCLFVALVEARNAFVYFLGTLAKEDRTEALTQVDPISNLSILMHAANNSDNRLLNILLAQFPNQAQRTQAILYYSDGFKGNALSCAVYAKSELSVTALLNNLNTIEDKVKLINQSVTFVHEEKEYTGSSFSYAMCIKATLALFAIIEQATTDEAIMEILGLQSPEPGLTVFMYAVKNGVDFVVTWAMTNLKNDVNKQLLVNYRGAFGKSAYELAEENLNDDMIDDMKRYVKKSIREASQQIGFFAMKDQLHANKQRTAEESQRPTSSEQQHNKILDIKKNIESEAITGLTEDGFLRLLEPLSAVELFLLMSAKEGELANDIFLTLVTAGFLKTIESILKKIVNEEDRISLILKFDVNSALLTVLHKAISMKNMHMIKLLFQFVSIDNRKRLLYTEDGVNTTCLFHAFIEYFDAYSYFIDSLEGKDKTEALSHVDKFTSSTVLMQAADMGDSRQVKKILSLFPDQLGRSQAILYYDSQKKINSLYYTVKSGFIESMSALLSGLDTIEDKVKLINQQVIFYIQEEEYISSSLAFALSKGSQLALYTMMEVLTTDDALMQVLGMESPEPGLTVFMYAVIKEIDFIVKWAMTHLKKDDNKQLLVNYRGTSSKSAYELAKEKNDEDMMNDMKDYVKKSMRNTSQQVGFFAMGETISANKKKASEVLKHFTGHDWNVQNAPDNVWLRVDPNNNVDTITKKLRSFYTTKEQLVVNSLDIQGTTYYKITISNFDYTALAKHLIEKVSTLPGCSAVLSLQFLS